MKNFKLLIEQIINTYASLDDYPLDNVKDIKTGQDYENSKRESGEIVKNLFHSFEPHDSKILTKYTNASSEHTELNHALINHALAKQHGLDIPLHLPSTLDEMHKIIHKNTKPSKEDLHVFSGVSHDFGNNILKYNVGDTFKSPAHISTTHNFAIANKYAYNKGSFNGNHIFHIHLKKDHPMLHVSNISCFPHEHETILPSGTTLKYHGSSEFTHDYEPLYIHHFETVHHE